MYILKGTAVLPYSIQVGGKKGCLGTNYIKRPVVLKKEED